MSPILFPSISRNSCDSLRNRRTDPDDPSLVTSEELLNNGSDLGEIIPPEWEQRRASGIGLSRVAPPSPPTLAIRRSTRPWPLPPRPGFSRSARRRGEQFLG